MLPTQSKVVFHNLPAALGIIQQAANTGDRLNRNFSLDLDKVETQRRDVGDVDRVAVDQCRQAEINRLQESVAESLDEAGIGDEIRVEIGIPQTVGLDPIQGCSILSGPDFGSLKSDLPEHV